MYIIVCIYTNAYITILFKKSENFDIFLIDEYNMNIIYKIIYSVIKINIFLQKFHFNNLMQLI